MLVQLRVRDLAIIEAVDVSFRPGFNVISGETGAGKSILMHALGLALGARASADAVRSGADSARVEATFELDEDGEDWLRDNDLAGEPGEPTILRRVVTRAGRSRAFVNDSPVTAAALRGLGTFLVDYASQHESAVLLDEAHHRAILDRFAGCEDLADEVHAAVASLRESEQDLARLRRSAEERASRLELLRYQRDELEALDPQPEEVEQLERDGEVLRQARQLGTALAAADEGLYSGHGSVVEGAGATLRLLRPFEGLDEELAATCEQLQQALFEIEDVARTLSGIAGRVHDDPARLEEVEERLDALRGMMRKHGVDEAGLTALLDRMDREIGELDRSEDRLADLEAGAARQRDGATALARRLSVARRAGAERLADRIAAELDELAMGGARFEPAVAPDPAGLSETGVDRVRFLLSANAGEDMRPLSRVASGGELSRMLLAVKQVLGAASAVGTFVLDEIDAGIGGATADVVARKLRSLADGRQLIAITHLPQIAALADAHYRVGKRELEGRTHAWVSALGPEERVEEVARMVAGDRHTERSRALAGEMLGAPPAHGGGGPVVH